MGDGVSERIEAITQNGIKLLALLSELDAPWRAHKESHTECVFQLPHVMTDGRGRDGKLIGGGFEAEMPCGRLERAQGV
jgi:hypothetical protein